MKFSRTDSEQSTTLQIIGSLDALSAPEIRPCIDELAGSDMGEIRVDLSSLELIDSSGVAVIVSLYKRVRARGGAVKIEGLSGQPLAIFKLLRLDRVFTG